MPRWSRTLLLMILAVTGAAVHAQGGAPYQSASSESQRVGEAYFAAYVARDWDHLEPLLADAGGFTDPTAAIIFGGVKHVGKAATMKGFREGYAAITQMAFKRSRAFYSGHYAVFEGTLDWTIKLEGGKLVQTREMPFVTVLRVEGGQVVDHQDLADYHPFLDAYRAAPAGG